MASFHTTRWSVVLAAGSKRGNADALALVCETYWYPLYGYVRRQGFDVDDARDLTQSFFADLLQRHSIATVHRERGRFRSFLLAALRHFLLNDVTRRRALKRGGGHVALPIDFEDGEARYAREPVNADTPERIFDRQWALEVLQRVMDRVRDDAVDTGKALDFERLKSCLIGDMPAGGYGALAKEIGSTEGAVKVAVHRLRRRFQRRLREEISQTLAPGQDVEGEIQALIRALQR